MRIVTDELKITNTHTSYGIVILTEKNRIHFINQKATQITGWTEGILVPFNFYYKNNELEDSLPLFHSQHTKYVDESLDLEVSVTKIDIEDHTYKMLILQEKYCRLPECKKKLSRERVLSQETERKRIARELHDHIGQSMYSIYLNLEHLLATTNGEVDPADLEKVVNSTKNVLTDLKSLSKTLNPQPIYKAGFKNYLKERIKDWKQLYGVEFHLILDLKDDVSNCKEKELHFFRFLQEAIHNAVRHGKAKTIMIRLHVLDGKTYFQIVDDGKGFKPNLDLQKITGLGLRHMEERVTILNGSVKWLSKVGGPTRVEGYVYLHKEDENDEDYDC